MLSGDHMTLMIDHLLRHNQNTFIIINIFITFVLIVTFITFITYPTFIIDITR